MIKKVKTSTSAKRYIHYFFTWAYKLCVSIYY